MPIKVLLRRAGLNRGPLRRRSDVVEVGLHLAALSLTTALFPIGAQVRAVVSTVSTVRTDPAMAEVAGLVAVVAWIGVVALAHKAGMWLLTRHRLAQWGEEWDRIGPS